MSLLSPEYLQAFRRMREIMTVVLSDLSRSPRVGDECRMGHLRSYWLTCMNPQGYWCVSDEDGGWVHRGSDYWAICRNPTRKFMVPTGLTSYTRADLMKP